MPAPRVLRALTLGLDVATFLWRRYSRLAQRPAPTGGVPPVELSGHQRIVSVPEDTDDDAAPDVSAPCTHTVTFGLDGQNYALDLSDQSAAELRETLGRYIAAGRRVGRPTRTSNITQPPRSGRPVRADEYDPAAIRQWARARGHQISDRGPIPATVRQAYTARRRGRAD